MFILNCLKRFSINIKQDFVFYVKSNNKNNKKSNKKAIKKQ